jgi:GNAT superfamily N-acetyltransferase
MNAPCPLLPDINRVFSAADVNALGKDRGPKFYELSLCYAQSQCCAGFPAQAMLQVNRAFACCLSNEEPVLQRWPLPYRVMAWLMMNRRNDQFIGNPRRHFQHLATRMVEPHKELRTWRAWACWYIAKALLPESDFPGDMKQIREEGVIEPTFAVIATKLRELSPADDEARWREALAYADIDMLASHAVNFEIISADKLPLVQQLAHSIWPRVYPAIISVEQIDYMLRQRYELAVLHDDLVRGVIYALIHRDAEAVGYIAIEPRNGDVFLHKLYLLPEVSGQGIGAAALQWVEAQALAHFRSALRLVVNKRNVQAIRAYLRAGFIFEHDVITDIGEGFVMDDFAMVKRLD